MAHYGVSYTTVAPKDFYEDCEKAYLNADCYQGDFLVVCVCERERNRVVFLLTFNDFNNPS